MITTEKSQNTSSQGHGLNHFLAELSRRRVCRAAALYAISMWLLCQIVELVYLQLGLPAWTLRFIIVLGLVGFPITLILSWLFDITPTGLQPDNQHKAESNNTTAKPRSVWEKVIDSCLIFVALLISAQLVTGFSGEDAFGATETSARIAVVPFRTAYGDNASVLSDGLLTELQYELINGSDMVVISPDDKYLTADTMSLTGCVSIGQDEVRVTATITDNTSGVITWSRVFERPRSDLLTMPADFAREIVAALPSEISASQGGKNAG